ncbi:MAG: MGMT family protein [Aeromicrobium sp.]|uniref:MGMT family protein n=1 Tax=Aeromicrobium sp. TaxID=1871063 RepID=UPI0039E29D21
MDEESGEEIDFTEAVLRVVETIPAGRVTTYGLIAEQIGRGGPRQVGGVMARDGHAVCWWRVVRADGSLPAHLMPDAQAEWQREGTPVKRGRVDIAKAVSGV